MTLDGFLPGHPLHEHVLTIRDRTLSIMGVRDPFRLLEEPFVEEAYKRDERMPYWADLWPSSAALAEYMFEAQESGLMPAPGAARGDGWDAMEIGCGVGLAGIAAAMIGYRVLCTDNEERALVLARENARRNGVADLVGTQLLDWRDDPPGRFGLVIVADCTYEQANVPLVVRFIKNALANAHAERGRCGVGGTALLADPDRLSARPLRWVAADAGLQVQVHERDLVMPAQEVSAPWLRSKGIDNRERTHLRATVHIYSMRHAL